jgi:hypothetical protein
MYTLFAASKAIARELLPMCAVLVVSVERSGTPLVNVQILKVEFALVFAARYWPSGERAMP